MDHGGPGGVGRDAEVSGEQLRLLAEHAGAVLATVDREGRLTYVGGALVRPADARRLTGARVADVYRSVPEVVEALNRSLAGRNHDTVLEVNGRIWNLHYRPTRDGDGAVTGAAVVAVDDTARVRAEDAMHELQEKLRVHASELEHTNQELRRTTEDHERLLSFASHELRTPLTPMLGFIDLLEQSLDEHLRPAERQYLGAMRRSAQRMRELVDELLVVSQATAGVLRARRAPIEVGDVVAQAVRGMPTPVEVSVDGTPRALADARHVEHIVGNLLSNAMKYGRPPIEVHVRHDRDDTLIDVRDHGDGVPDGFVDQLFGSYTRADQVMAAADGVGLGLAIVDMLVRLNEGSIRYEPLATLSGARFVVRLPATD